MADEPADRQGLVRRTVRGALRPARRPRRVAGARLAAAPDLKALEDETSRFVSDGGEHGIEEERRFAYVAFTRARTALLLTAPVWADASTPRLTSRFLTELLEHPDLGLTAGRSPGVPVPDERRQGGQPPSGRPVQGSWPVDHLAGRRAALSEAVETVLAQMRAAAEARAAGDDSATGDRHGG